MTTDLRHLARTLIPRGAVTPHETFVPLGAPIPEPTVWTTAEPTDDNPPCDTDVAGGQEP